MARGQPRPQRHLKILDKLQIITLNEKVAGMPMRKFTDMMNNSDNFLIILTETALLFENKKFFDSLLISMSYLAKN